MSSLFFVLTYLFELPILNLIFLTIAVIMSKSSASMLFSVYCPSLRDTGKVSTVVGLVDFLSYIAAALTSTTFANAVSKIGWGNLILVWAGIVLFGVFVSLPYRKIFNIK